MTIKGGQKLKCVQFASGREGPTGPLDIFMSTDITPALEITKVSDEVHLEWDKRHLMYPWSEVTWSEI